MIKNISDIYDDFSRSTNDEMAPIIKEKTKSKKATEIDKWVSEVIWEEGEEYENEEEEDKEDEDEDEEEEEAEVNDNYEEDTTADHNEDNDSNKDNDKDN
jgi:hypothetical protein